MAEDLKIINKILKYYQYNKVDVQNNILHTLREASHVGEKAVFHLSFQAPPRGPFRALIFQNKFLVPKLVLTKPSALI